VHTVVFGPHSFSQSLEVLFGHCSYELGGNSVMVRITHWNEPLSSLDIDYVVQLLHRTESPGGYLEW
jgi:hypothetical protein